MKTKEIQSQEEYEYVLARLKKGEAIIEEAGGFQKAPKHWVDKFQELANYALEWEIDNDLLPI